MRRLVILVSVAGMVLMSIGARIWDPFPSDLVVALYIQKIELPGLLTFMEGVSNLARGLPMILYGSFLAMVFIWAFRFRKECYTAILTPLLFGLGPLMKLVVSRPRPPAELLYRSTHDFSGLGFPSGHAFQSALFFGFLVYLSSIYVSRLWLKRLIQYALIFLTGAVGISRIYIGAHWPSDVFGGYLLAVPILMLLSAYHGRVRSKNQTQEPLQATTSRLGVID